MTLGFLGDLLGLNSGDATINAANSNRGVISQYGTDANNLIDQGATAAGGYLNSANDLNAGLVSQYQNGANLYADALGVNGAAGNANATSAFTTSPGYQFSLDQGLQALDRSAAAHGTLQSGQSGIDTATYATNAANQNYNTWLNNLSGYNGNLNTAVAGQTGALDNLGNLATGTASAKVGVAGDVASGSTAANNQQAAGETANTQGLANLGKTALGAVGNIFGYGGF